MKETWLDKLTYARKGIVSLQEQYPKDACLLSALSQLDYLIALECGDEQDDSLLEKIDVGYLAMYQLIGILSHEMSVALCDIACKVKRDLRLQGRKSNLP